MPASPSADAALARIEAFARQGMLVEAEQASAELLQQWPADHRGWGWLGTLKLVGQQFAEAEQALRQAIALCDSNPQYWMNAAMVLRAQGKSAEAESFARRGVALEPANPAQWIGLGGNLFELRRHDEAARAYRQSLALDATNAAVWADLGAVEHLRGQIALALEALERSVALAPGQLELQARHAMLLIECGQAARGVALLQPVVQQSPQMALAWLGLGRAYRMLDNMPQAEAAFRRAVQLAPQNREARHDLALVLLALCQHAEAESVIRQLVTDDPAFAQAWLLLGVVLHVQARVEEALPVLRRSVELAPTPVAHSKLLVSLPYADGTSPEQLLAEHQAWDAAYARPLLPPAPPGIVARSAGTPLRLGFVACDFAAGPTGFLALRAIESLDKSQCSVACYSDRLREDEYTARFRKAADAWRPAVGQTDEDLAHQIRADEIDVLFDMSGHVGLRLLTFARRPAPLQITWLGYVGTTGLAAMDYLLADRFHVTPGEEAWYSEEVLRMPHSYACYGPPRGTLPVAGLPVLSRGQFTFGCFNNPVKLTPALLDLWAAILNRTGQSQLLLKYYGLEQPHLQGWIREQFARRGISGERILMEGWSPHLELLAAYNRVDLALDTQPYSGGLTTCEALWMGVPVVTYPGRTFAGRHATSYLSNVGLPQFVAKDREDYVELATQWARRIDELVAIRMQLREQMRQSPVCDGPQFASDLLTAARRAWARKVGVSAGRGRT